jgi:hypothetical protein
MTSRESNDCAPRDPRASEMVDAIFFLGTPLLDQGQVLSFLFVHSESPLAFGRDQAFYKLRAKSRAASASSRNGYARLKVPSTVDPKFYRARLWVVEALAHISARCRNHLISSSYEFAGS